MSISDCKGCKVSAVGHKVEIFGDAPVEPLVRTLMNGKLKHFRDKTIYHWKCNSCGYESLRFSDKDKTEQFHPVEPHGKDLDDRIPENIRQDFDEARKIAELSPRCGNVLLRTCLEGLCNWIAEEFLEDDKKAKYPEKELHRKIEYIKKHTTFVSDRLFKKMNIIKEYGNDIHTIKTIDDSDTLESFQAMLRFIESIGNHIVLFIQEREDANEYHSKIPKKTKT